MKRERLTAEDFKIDNSIPRPQSKQLCDPVNSRLEITEENREPRKPLERLPVTFKERAIYYAEQGLSPMEISHKLRMGCANVAVAIRDLAAMGIHFER